jgi:hypothetical protein
MAIIEHDHHPEIVENSQGMHRLELLGLDEQLSNSRDRREYFASLSGESFTRAVGYIKSITSGESISYGYEDGNLPSGDMPPFEDKAYLMDLTAQAIREIGSDPSLDNRTALRRMGLTAAGALQYIHPKEDGNGRTGRTLHYLMEFGTERGDKAFGEEMYAIIGKLPVYDSDSKRAIDDTTPPALDIALNMYMRQKQPDQYASTSGRERASARAVAFLDMMRGQATVPVIERVVIGHGTHRQGDLRFETFEPGQIDGASLYEKQYLASSEVPNRLASDIPIDAHRVMATGHIIANTYPPEIL